VIRGDALSIFGNLPRGTVGGNCDRTGSNQNEIPGHARGVIAIGDIATGVVAFGEFSRGVLALGGLAIGYVAAGGTAVGYIAARDWLRTTTPLAGRYWGNSCTGLGIEMRRQQFSSPISYVRS